MEPEAEVDIKEQITTELKKLDFQTKVKAFAVNHYLEKKKALDEELELKIKELTILYEGKSAPYYKASGEIINGTRKPAGEEISGVEAILTDEEQNKLGEVTNEPVKDYWLKCFQNCYLLKNEIKEKDPDVLKHLQNVEYKALDTNHFEILFTFTPNDYFTNETLKKEYFIKDEEPVKSIGTTIAWKEGKNITKKTVKQTQKNKKSGAKRVITKEVEDESFFNLFGSVNLENPEDVEKMEEEEAAKLEERNNIDYDICRSLIDEVIPYSLEYFLNVKQEEEEDDFEDEDDDLDGDDGGDDDDDDDEDSKPPAKKEKGGKKPKKSKDSEGTAEPAKQDEKAPECKQQ